MYAENVYFGPEKKTLVKKSMGRTVRGMLTCDGSFESLFSVVNLDKSAICCNTHIHTRNGTLVVRPRGTAGRRITYPIITCVPPTDAASRNKNLEPSHYRK